MRCAGLLDSSVSASMSTAVLTPSTCPQGHTLNLLDSATGFRFCDDCNRKEVGTPGCPSLHCTQCGYDLCLPCFDLRLAQDRCPTASHAMHRLDNAATLRFCDGCGQNPLGTLQRPCMSCSPCSYDLCIECYEKRERRQQQASGTGLSCGNNI